MPWANSIDPDQTAPDQGILSAYFRHTTLWYSLVQILW